MFPKYSQLFDSQLRKKKLDEKWLRRRVQEYNRIDRAYQLSIEEAMNPQPEKHEACQFVEAEELE